MTQLGVLTWEKLLHRWSQVEPSPEVCLIVRVLADAIATEPDEASRQGRDPFVGGFFGNGGFEHYCAAIRLNAQFVWEQIHVANASRVHVHRQGDARAHEHE